MSTLSYDAINKTFRDRMITYVDPATAKKLSNFLGGDNVYQSVPPNPAPTKYVLMRIINDRSGMYGERIEADLELEVWGKVFADVRGAADLLDKALKQYTDASAGLLRARTRQRDDIPVGSGDADPTFYRVRLLVNFFAWPLVLINT